MKKNKHIFFLSFLLLCFSITIAQEDVAEDNQAILNPAHQQFAGYSIFDSQPIYNSPWEWLHQTPQGNTLRWVKMWDANNWYACGFGGTFMKTTNGGSTWFVNKMINGGGTSQSNYPVYDMHFFDMNTGIGVGGFGTIVKTTDGGVTWDSLSSFPTAATAYDVFFVDDTLGFACGTTSMRIYKTVDGGNNWTQIWGDLPSTTCYSVYASDENNIVMGSSSGNMRITTNGGVNWTSVNAGWTSIPYAVRFSDPMNGWVCASAGNVAYTTNGGTSWTNAGPIPVTSTLYDLDILATTTQTLNESFEDVTFPPTGWHSKNLLGTNVWARSTVTPHSGIACARISYQATGGEDWLVTPQINVVAGDSLVFWWRNAFSSPYPPDSLIIRVSTTDTAVASFSNILVKIDGATAPSTWTRHAYSLSGYTGNIYIAFQHKNLDGNGGYLDDVTVGEPMMSSQVFVTGDPFNIYTTTNMGVNWTAVPFLGSPQPWTSTYYSSDFLAADNFVTVGAFGLINEVDPTDAATCHTNFIKAGIFYDVWASSATGTVIAAGSASSAATFDQAIYSTDGGETWAVSAMVDSADLDFNSLSMVSATTGYAAGEDHRVMKTTNGGATWFRVTDPATTTSDLETVSFVDVNTGYVFGASGAGFKTTDGGTTWTPLTTTITGIIYGSHFLDAQTGFIVGASGNGRKTTDGGTTFTTMTTDMATSAIYSIYMVDANIGYLCGSTGKVRKTTDGGTTWTNVDVGNTSPTLYQVEFKDENYGMTVGSVGRTYYTSNGGTTWNYENTSMSTIYGLSIEKTSADTSAAFIAGTNAYIMRNHKVIIPVELASFTASVNGDDVTLSWITATELNNSGFQVERKTGEENWVELGFVQGKGTTTETQVYTFIDKDLISGKYNYRIKQIDFNGSHKYYDLNEEVEIAAPNSYDLSQNYPNPFNPTTKIKYSVPVEGFVNIAVFNILGEKVANLVNSIQKAGKYELSFDATNLSSGMYIYRMESGNYVSIKKMMILK
jgi:photosystem II stability/assembly factor-like uncharacterized protein